MTIDHNATLQMLIPLVIQVISDNMNISTLDAIKIFYNSILYEKLETETTKVWHFSPLALYEILETEIKTGKLLFPVSP
jgi:hypothetical protein